ncbi:MULTISPECIES: hypothetical protein [unclassified Pseudomonas]|uniref:hypothetical protein n=1 Tax=unclassified Pseudomonas TaxID=196821 RepID=UPI0018E7F8BE|nr:MULTISPECIES: hypothetical protein [unclassified Pseudomonas]MBJ2241240.1 hypothetical protein [Pseudomonas sp. MF6768]MBJ2263691.1 hypothetical protein [Pseudomonas sp. MF6787]
MRGLITMILLLIAGQASAGEQIISVQHDSSRSVTCWITPQGGISCLPDSSLQHQQQATPSSEAGRASQASSSSENAPLQAAPAPGDERFQL